MIDRDTAPWGVFLLRISLGGMFLAHSLLLKLVQLTLPGTVEVFVSFGLPGDLAYVVFWLEVVGGLLLVLGVQARWVALALAPILVGATWVHWGNGWLFLNDGGGWEYPACLFVLCLVQGLLGDGRLALSPSRLPRMPTLHDPVSTVHRGPTP